MVCYDTHIFDIEALFKNRSTSAHMEHISCSCKIIFQQIRNVLETTKNPHSQAINSYYHSSQTKKIDYRFQSSYIFLLHEPNHLTHLKTKKSFKTFQINHRTITSLQGEIPKYIKP